MKLSYFIPLIAILMLNASFAETPNCLANQYSTTQRPSIQSIRNLNDFINWRTFLSFNETTIAKIPLAKRADSKGPSSLVGFDIDDRAWQYDFLSTQWSQGGCGTYKKTTDLRTADNVYNFKFWQYVDISYYFGHALLTIPPTMWTNAAHKNGVISIGTFNLNDMDPGFLLDDKYLPQTIHTLSEIAKTLGFDGYLINYENNELAYVKPFLILMNALKKEGLTIIWYDAPISGGFANYLNPAAVPYLLSAGYFQSNYGWDYADNKPAQSEKILNAFGLGNLKDHVFQMGDSYRNPAKETPFQLCSQSQDQFFKRFKDIYKDESHTSHYTGLGFYAPNWTMFGGNPGPDPERDTHVPSTNQFEQSDAAYWEGSGIYGCGHDDYRNVSYFVEPRTVITHLPFYTNFNTGVGINYFAKGKLLSQGSWSNFSIQCILPTWQNVKTDENSSAKTYFDYQTAYDGGASWKIEDNTPSHNMVTFKLFKTQFAIGNKTEIDLIVKASSNEDIHIVLNQNPLKLSQAINLDNGWQKLIFNVSGTMTVNEIDMSIQPNKDGKINVNVGSLKIYDPNSLPIPENQVITPQGSMLTWTAKHPDSLYRIYGKNPQRTYTLLNEVANTTYDLHGSIFNGTVDSAKFATYLIQEVTIAGDVITP